MTEFWVFGYGSLMWNPGFEFLERRKATVHGYHRALCVRSWVHRGTKDYPGLVLGLDRGGACRGIAFRVAMENRDAVIHYLRERELVTHVYVEREIAARLDDGTKIQALTYVIDRMHEQYAGSLDMDEAAETIRNAVGRSGHNRDYLGNTVQHLREMGIRDSLLEHLLAKSEPAKS